MQWTQLVREYIFGRVHAGWHAPSEKASVRARGETGGLDRDDNGWRRVDERLMNVGGGEGTTFLIVGNYQIFHGIIQ